MIGSNNAPTFAFARFQIGALEPATRSELIAGWFLGSFPWTLRKRCPERKWAKTRMHNREERRRLKAQWSSLSVANAATESLKDVFNYAMLNSASNENWNDAWNFDWHPPASGARLVKNFFILASGEAATAKRHKAWVENFVERRSCIVETGRSSGKGWQLVLGWGKLVKRKTWDYLAEKLLHCCRSCFIVAILASKLLE